MKRLRPLDTAILALFVPLWALCFALSLAATLSDTGYSPIDISRPRADEYPVLTGFKLARAAASGLRVGDRLLRVADTDLRGRGPIALAVCFAALQGPAQPVPVVYERGGERRATTLAAGSYAIYWPRLPAAAVFAFAAVFLFVRARPSVTVRVIVHTYMCVALLLACTFAGGPLETGFSIVVHVLSLSLAAPLAVRGARLFPHEIEPTSAWARRGHWLFAVLGPLDASRFYALPFPRPVGTWGTSIVGVLCTATLVGATVRSYQRSDAIGRRQLRWFFLGVYGALLPPLVATVLAVADARFTPWLVVSMSALGVVPIGLLIAVVQYNLFDVDRLLSAATSYTLLGIVFLAGLLAAVPGLAQALSGPIGVEPTTAQVVLSLVLASIIVGMRQQLRPRVDQVFFAERYALERGFDQLLDALSGCRAPDELTRLSGERLDALLRPESIAIYARGAEAYAPVFVRGRVIPPAFHARSPLIAALEARATPLAGERAGKGRGAAALSPFDRAALETLGVPVVLPVRRGAQLVAFVCLGPKRSGDVYTSTDLALLSGVADKVSSELLRFDQAEIIRQGRAMQEALRRYVPGAVVEELVSGRDLEAGEREVAVLFVDIRGYSTYSEGRPPTEIFSTVNRYTETVSQIVRAAGGSVVEFNGDGMMAVFGAPRALADKERAAVAAARQVVAAVGALDAGGAAPIAVGVGIATGPAFVGNVRAVDRYIWTAIGNTTNLAARLQALTRELGAAIVIDAATWRSAGAPARDFIRHADVPIRGRMQREEIYALPLPAV